jgi:peroxiredoxin Q/BCP
MSRPDVGDVAPDFTLQGTAGAFTLSEHRGERVVLLFYPGDDTAVCTKQFCAYRDAASEMADLGARFVGISTQGMASKESFRAKYGLTTELLADPDGAVCAAYGVLAKRLGIAKRTVFIVDENGLIALRHTNFLSLTYEGVEDLRRALESMASPASRR